jgi:hypothetical protein
MAFKSGKGFRCWTKKVRRSVINKERPRVVNVRKRQEVSTKCDLGEIKGGRNDDVRAVRVPMDDRGANKGLNRGKGFFLVERWMLNSATKARSTTTTTSQVRRCSES